MSARTDDARVVQYPTTAQVKGSTNIIVAVVATQDLEPGDVLWRFKEEAAPNESRRGNNTNRCSPSYKCVQYWIGLAHHQYQHTHRHREHITPQKHDNTPTSHHSCRQYQGSRRSPGTSSNALSMTVLDVRQRAIAPRARTDRLVNGMCRK